MAEQFLAKADGQSFAPKGIRIYQERDVALMGKLNRRFSDMENSYKYQEEHFSRIAPYFAPQYLRYIKRKGGKKYNSMADWKSTISAQAVESVKITVAGLSSINTPETNPWAMLTAFDKDLNDWHRVRRYLEVCSKSGMRIFAKNGFYSDMPKVYECALVFGTAASFIDEDKETLLRYISCPPGTYFIGSNFKGDVDSIGRRQVFTARQMVEKFGVDNVSESVRLAATGKNEDMEVTVRHIVYPRSVSPIFKNEFSKLAKNKPWASVWWEETATDGRFLKISGYDFRPFSVPRWQTFADQPWGLPPSFAAVKPLQHMEKYMALLKSAVEKQADPAFFVDSRIANFVSFMPGAHNAVDTGDLANAARPAQNLVFDVMGVKSLFDDFLSQMQNSMFSTYFSLFINEDRRQMTAAEAGYKNEEKSLLLGSTTSLFNTDKFNHEVDLVYELSNRAGILPEPPPEIQGEELEIEYTSPFAIAQKNRDFMSMQQVLGSIGNLAGIFPEETKAKIDFMAAVDQMVEKTGASTKFIRSTEDANALLASSREQQQASQQMQMMGQAAQGAQVLSQIQTSNGGNVLTEALGL
jgi:hypothetical protein